MCGLMGEGSLTSGHLTTKEPSGLKELSSQEQQQPQLSRDIACPNSLSLSAMVFLLEEMGVLLEVFLFTIQSLFFLLLFV